MAKYGINNSGKVSYKPMKDYEKRQKNKKGQYKGSIHDKGAQRKKEWTWATFFFWCIVVAAVVAYFYEKGQGQ